MKILENRTLSSPNKMVWELFQALRRLCIRVNEYGDDSDASEMRQDAALAIIVAVQCVEVFFNVYFRVIISEVVYSHSSERISADLANTQFGLDRKIKDWPYVVFGRKLSLGEGAGQRFIKLKNLRHKLMHFSSSHETLTAPGFEIHGLADTTAYHSLTPQSAIDALDTVESVLCEIFILRGIPSSSLPEALHTWTGKPLI